MLWPKQIRIRVIPVLVTGIHRAANSGAREWLDPGHKARDDRVAPMSVTEH